MFSYKGYKGTYLRVNLSTSRIQKNALPESLARDYLGGTGFCAKVLWDEVGPGIGSLEPENRLIFATGPLTGAFFTPAGRFVIAAKSPLTGIWGESHSGGNWGPELKYAGYDFIIFQGKSEKLVYLYIDDECVELREAGHLWGKDTRETIKSIRDELSDDTIEVACIGPAGENMVRYGCIMVDFYRAAGRTGLGAVMGSKNLKAVAVHGTGSVEVADPERYMEVADYAFKKITTGAWGEVCESSLGMYGTPNLVSAVNAIGRLPTKNHWTGVFEAAEKIGPDILRENYRIARESCFTCGIQCKYISHVKRGPYKDTITGGPEFETIMALGSNCLNDDIEAIIHANQLCNLYGIDTISCGKTISFAMECYENKILSKEDADGVDLTWGNPEAITTLIHKIAKREGLGNILAEGVKRAAEVIGKGAERYAIHGKGMEVSGQDSRAQKSVGLTHAISCRGADHLRALSSLEELGFGKTIEKRFGKEKATDIQDLLSTTYKAQVVKDVEDLYAIVDSLLICKYGTMWPPVYYFDDLAILIPPLTGMKEYGDLKYLRLTAERICNLRRAFNIREGMTRKDDVLHPRFTKEPMPSGPAKGHVCHLESMLHEYYELREWDKATGLIPRRTLEKFGLGHVADQLESMEKLP